MDLHRGRALGRQRLQVLGRGHKRQNHRVIRVHASKAPGQKRLLDGELFSHLATVLVLGGGMERYWVVDGSLVKGSQTRDGPGQAEEKSTWLIPSGPRKPSSGKRRIGKSGCERHVLCLGTETWLCSK
jgi:hypothetical protein